MLLARLGARAPIPYVQDAILNLRHPYIVVATATTDDSIHLMYIYMYNAQALCIYHKFAGLAVATKPLTE